MYYFSSIIITLCFNYLIFNIVCSSHNPYLLIDSTTSCIEENHNQDLMNKFFVHFKISYLNKYEPRHITIFGTTERDLDKVQPLYENYPRIIYYTDKKQCLYTKLFNPGNFVVIFLREFTEKYFENKIDILSGCAECKILFISDGIIHIEDIQLLFHLSHRQNLGHIEFVHFEDNVVRMYSHFITNNCSMEVRSTIVWKPGNNLKEIDSWGFLERDLNGCPVSISTSSFTPKMIIETRKNGSVTIVGGREGELVLVIAKALNFTLSLRSPSVSERLRYSRKASIVNDVVSGLADIGIGRLRPTNDIHETIVHSVMYDDECITWGVPRIIKWSNNVVWVEFTWKVWALVGLVFVIACTTGYAFEKMSSLKRGDDNRTKIGLIVVILDVIQIHLGNPVSEVPVLAGGKFALILFLCYAMVLTTAYKTSLASILTTEKGTPTIVDVEGIIRANLSLGGSQYDFNMLRDQMNESEINLKLIERFVVNNNDTETLQRLKFNENFAFLARGSSLHNEKQKSVRDHESVSFDVFDNCVLAYHTVMIVRKGSFLRKPVNIVIRRLAEAGILEHWDNDKFDADKILKHRNAAKFYEKRAGHKFQTIFLLYASCIALCILIFFIELIIHKLRLSKSRRSNNIDL